MDEGRGFLNTNLSSEVQKAMRELVGKIRTEGFFATHAFEPTIGTDGANTLMQVAPPALWDKYTKNNKSIYSLFIGVEGDNCTCLWCGNVQHGKLKRAVGHFRAKHLGHRPFSCGLAHVTGKVW